MRIPFLTALLLFVVTTAAAGQVLPIPRDNTRADLRRFRAESLRGAQDVLTQWSAAWGRDDARTAADLHTKDGRLQLPDQAAPVEGTRAVEEALSTHLPQVGRLSLSLLDGEASGRLVYLYGRYHSEPQPGAPADAAASPTGSYIALVQSQGRSWRIRALLFYAEPTGAAVVSLP